LSQLVKLTYWTTLLGAGPVASGWSIGLHLV